MIGYNYILPKSLNPDYEYASYTDPNGEKVVLNYRSTSVDPGRNILKYRFLHTLKADLELDYRNYLLGFSIKYFSKINNLDKAIADLEKTLENTGGSLQPLKYMDYFRNKIGRAHV